MKKTSDGKLWRGPFCMEVCLFRQAAMWGGNGVIYEHNKGGVSKCAPPFFTHKAPTFTSWGFVIT